MQIIDKLAWIHIENKKTLFVRSRGKDAFFNPGGKREEGETDEQALIREIKEELNVDLVPETIKYVETFSAQAHGKPEGTMVEIKCYEADFSGELTPNAEIEEIGWLTSNDMEKTSATGQLSLEWLKKRELID